MARSTLRKATEAKIRSKIRRNDPAMRWLLQDFQSPEEALSKLSVLTNDMATGSAIKRCIEACEVGHSKAEAIDLLLWAYADPIKTYCSNIGKWFRTDAEQEGSLAIIEATQTFKPQQHATRYIPEAFRKAVIGHVRNRRQEELNQCWLPEKVADFVERGCFCGEDPPESRAPRSSATTQQREDCQEVVALLQTTAISATVAKGLQPWIQSRLYSESMIDYARREMPTVDSAKASLALRKRAARFQRYLQRQFKNRQAKYVAIECLWVAGCERGNPVAMSTLHNAEASMPRTGRWEKREKRRR